MIMQPFPYKAVCSLLYIWMVLWLCAYVFVLLRVLSWLLVENLLSPKCCADRDKYCRLMLNGSDAVWWVGGFQVELEPLGLFKVDFMQGSVIRGEEDQNMTSCLIFLFMGVVKVSNQCYVRLMSDHSEFCEQGFDLTTLSSYFQGQN